MTEGASAEAWAEAMADEVLRKEVRLVERAEGKESMAIEAPLMVESHDSYRSLHFPIAD